MFLNAFAASILNMGFAQKKIKLSRLLLNITKDTHQEDMTSRNVVSRLPYMSEKQTTDGA
jgi:hypothetical protein